MGVGPHEHWSMPSPRVAEQQGLGVQGTPSRRCYTSRVSEGIRRIVHVDMDAFYASVEQRDEPSLKGKPVAVGGRPERRGVVAAASYEARVFGVHSAMSMTKAVRVCPSLVIVRPDFSKYRAVSREVFDIFRSATELVEPLSLDEAYLDVTVNAWGEPLATPVAKRLKRLIQEHTGLTASAGVAPNKFLAKIASGWQKPDGLTVVALERVERFLQGLPVEALWGVGPVTAAKLRAQGIKRLVDVRPVDLDTLRQTVGSLAESLQRLAWGHDDRPVVTNRPSKSAGSEHTFADDLLDLDTIRAELDRLARRAADWLERHRRTARTVTIKMRYADFTTITRSHSAPATTQGADEVAQRALRLLDRTDAGARPVRLLGVSVHGLESLDEDPRSSADADRLPFGNGAIHVGAPPGYDANVLNGTRNAILRRVQPISVHGQVSCDVYFSDADEPDGAVHTARVGPEAMVHGLEPGDPIQLQYLMGAVTAVTRGAP